MKECSKCGAKNPDSAKTCTNCGSREFEGVRLSNVAAAAGASYIPQANYPQQVYVPQFQAYDLNKASFYRPLGGFLKFIVVMNYISGVGSFIGAVFYLISYIKLASWISSINSSTAAFITFLGIVLSAIFGFAGYISIKLARKIDNKDPGFLRFIQIVYTVSIVATLIIVFAIKSYTEKNYYGEINTSTTVFYLVISIISFIIWNLYFCTSERVYYYMGSVSYIKNSLYTAGVTRWDAIEASRLSGEEPSKLEQVNRDIAASQVDNTPYHYSPSTPVTNTVSNFANAGSTVNVNAGSSVNAGSTVNPVPSNTSSANVSSSDKLSIEDMEALKKLKELYDMGAISEEEYNGFRNRYMPENKESLEESTVPQNTDSKADKQDDTSWRCNGCQTVNPAGSKICNYCGGVKLIVGFTPVSDNEIEPSSSEAASSAADIVSAPAAEPMNIAQFCSMCGARLVPGGKFCMSCGTPVEG